MDQSNRQMILSRKFKTENMHPTAMIVFLQEDDPEHIPMIQSISWKTKEDPVSWNDSEGGVHLFLLVYCSLEAIQRFIEAL